MCSLYLTPSIATIHSGFSTRSTPGYAISMYAVDNLLP